MTEIEKCIREDLAKARMMVVSTISGDQPWSFTAYFVADEDLHLYWISKTSSRHSQEISIHSKVAVNIPVKFDDLNVIGLQVEGEAELVQDKALIQQKAKLYADKFVRGEEWYQNFIAEQGPFKLYTIKPTLFVLYDRVNFPDAERQEWKLN